MHLPLVLVRCRDIDAIAVLDESLALREGIVLASHRACLERIDGPPEGDGTKQVNPESTHGHQDIQQAIAGILSAKEQRRTDSDGQGNLLPASLLRAAAADDDGQRTKSQANGPDSPPVVHRPTAIDTQHQRVCQLSVQADSGPERIRFIVNHKQGQRSCEYQERRVHGFGL